MPNSDFPSTFPLAIGFHTLKVLDGEFLVSKHKKAEYFSIKLEGSLWASIFPSSLMTIRPHLEAMGIVCEGRDPKEVLPELVGHSLVCEITQEWIGSDGTYPRVRIDFKASAKLKA